MNKDIMQASCGFASHKGGRDEQQDRVIIQVLSHSSLLVVADGMGGHRDGAAAAQFLMDCAVRAHQELEGNIQNPEEFFNRVFEDAWKQIRDFARSSGTSPHTTGVMALVFADRTAAWAHLGDARLYRLRDGAVPWRTSDHSVVQLLLLEGKITEEEMADHPDQNRLWRSVGGDKFYKPKCGASEAPLAAGEILLLCSDGLWEQVSAAEMMSVAASMPPPEAARKLVNLAARRGGAQGDNVSVSLWATPFF